MKSFNIIKGFLILLFIATPIIIHAQNTTFYGGIKGNVIDQVTLQPLAFCTIQITELQMGTTSNEQGDFFLDNVPEGKYNVTFSFVGYHEKVISEVQVIRNKISFHEIQLTENSFSLDAVELIVHKYENNSSMPVGTFSLSREEIFRSPASNGNIFKAISVIPGVQSGSGSFSALAVRGQGTEENAMYVDGFPIFDLSHLSSSRGGFDDANGGRFSIFGPRVIDGLVIQTGGFSSLYGRKSSSYLGLSVKEGNPENAEIDIMGSLTGASINYSGPSFIHDNTTAFLSFRYQNFEPILNITDQVDLGFPSFSDLTLKTVTKLNDKNRVTVLALYNPEIFERTTENVAADEELESTFITDIDIKRSLLGVKLRTLLNEKSNWINLLYYRNKTSDISFGKAYPEFKANGDLPDSNEIPFNNNKGAFDSKEEEIGFRSVYTNSIRDNITLKAGIDLARVSIDHRRVLRETDTIYSFYRDELPLNQQAQSFFILEPQNFDSSFIGEETNASAFANLRVAPTRRLNLNIGIRYDYTGFSNAGKVSPRLSGSLKLSEKSSINIATGIFYQDPLFVDIADNDGGKLDPEKAIHYIAGYKHYFSSDLKFTGEIYYKDFDDLIVRPNTAINSLANQGDGFAYGIDLSLVKRLSDKYNGQVSYSYSESKRNNRDGKGEYDYLYSQPHLFNFLLSYQPSIKWIFSGKIRYSTGQPTNSAILFSDVHSTVGFERFGQELTGINDIRNDAVIGIDFRMDRRFQFRKSAFTTFIDIQNVLNRENASTRTFHERTGEYEPMALGILPTIGLRLEL